MPQGDVERSSDDSPGIVNASQIDVAEPEMNKSFQERPEDEDDKATNRRPSSSLEKSDSYRLETETKTASPKNGHRQQQQQQRVYKLHAAFQFQPPLVPSERLGRDSGCLGAVAGQGHVPGHASLLVPPAPGGSGGGPVGGNGEHQCGRTLLRVRPLQAPVRPGGAAVRRRNLCSGAKVFVNIVD